MSDKLEAALSYASRGFRVFPCTAGTKVPLKDSAGWQDATTDEACIRAWWEENPHYNVAIATGLSNLVVVDVDPAGLARWPDMLEAHPDLAEAARIAPRVETPRGGFHLYFAGSGPSSASKLAGGVDTRGLGGYVLAPPSVVSDGKADGCYIGDLSWVDPAPLPPAFAAHLAKIKPPAERSAPTLPPEEIRWDMPETIIRAELWLQGRVDAGDVAVEGCGGDQRTYEVACRVLEMGLTPQTATELLASVWNPHCSPPWDEEELATKIRNAWDYGQETRGGKAERPAADEHGHLIADDPQEEEDELAWLVPKHIVVARNEAKPVEWIVPNVIPRLGSGLIYGPSETYKTFLLLDLALAVATGHGPNWWDGPDREPRPVLFLAGEGPNALKTKRVNAWMALHPFPQILERSKFYMIERVPPFETSTYWTKMVENWKRVNTEMPAMVIVDTISKGMFGLDENNARDSSRATGRLDWLAREFDAFVMAVHHTGKDASRGARGSYAWYANMDTILETDRRNPNHMATDIYVRKQKDGDPLKDPLHFEAVPQGESLAFRRNWNYTAPVEYQEGEHPTGVDSEDWAQPEAMIAALKAGPLHTDHLTDTLSSRYEVDAKHVRRALKRMSKGRYKAWVPDGHIWKIPVEMVAIEDEGSEF